MPWHRRYIWEPFEELRKMREWIENMLSETGPLSFGPRMLPETTGEEFARTAVPCVDMIEEEDKIRVIADMPGVEKEDISLNIKGDMLEISAERRIEEEEERKGYIRKERTYTKYYRKMPLPADIDVDKIEATFKNGVLEVSMPKVKEAVKAKKIEIK